MWCGFLNIKPHTTQCGVVLSLPLAVWLLYFTVLVGLGAIMWFEAV